MTALPRDPCPAALRDRPPAVRASRLMRAAARAIEADAAAILREAGIGAGGEGDAAKLAVLQALAAAALLHLPERHRAGMVAQVFEDHLAAGMPHPLAGTVTAEARFWAGMAQPAELEAYLCALCDVVAGRVTAEAARKRLMLELWETLPEDWRAGFLRAVGGTR